MTIKKDPRERLAELLGSNSKNFLDTGLTMTEFMQLADAEKLSTSWCIQTPAVRRRRLSAIIRLAVELEHVRETTGFSTRIAEHAIEAVIEGDWKMVQELADHFSFDSEGVELRQKYAPIFDTFRELLHQTMRAEKELPT